MAHKIKRFANTVIAEIAECERVCNLYNRLYELLNELSGEDYTQLNKEFAAGEIKSLEDLGKRFDELADYEYRKANRLLKTDFKQAK